jgi:ribonuclease HI
MPKSVETDNASGSVPKFYYAVQKGYKRDVYLTFDECKKQTNGFRGAIFRKFKSLKEAEEFAFPERIGSDIGTGKGADNKINEGDKSWVKSAHQSAMEFMTSLPFEKQQEYLQKQLEEKQKKELADKAKAEFVPEYAPSQDIKIENRINVWISGHAAGLGTISVYFGEGDKRNFVGLMNWTGAFDISRLRAAACVRAISTVTKALFDEGKDASTHSIVLHSESRYLALAVNKWLTFWAKTGKDKAVAEKNSDIFRFMYKQLHKSKVKICCVVDLKTNTNCIAAEKMAREFYENGYEKNKQ